VHLPALVEIRNGDDADRRGRPGRGIHDLSDMPIDAEQFFLSRASDAGQRILTRPVAIAVAAAPWQ
jgi:hypothetical protein